MENNRLKIIKIGEAWLSGGSSEKMPEKDVYRIKKTKLGYTWLPFYRTRVAIAELKMAHQIKSAVRRSRTAAR